MVFSSVSKWNFWITIIVALSVFMQTSVVTGKSAEPPIDTSRSGDNSTWIEVDRLETDLVVEKGSQTFIRFDNETGRLSVTDELDYMRALSTRAQEAVMRAPGWLRDDLSRKFAYAGIESFDLREVEIAFGDLDGDGDNDMLGTNFTAINLYRNHGTRHLSLFSWDRMLFDTVGNLNGASFRQPSLGDLDGDGDLDLVAVWSGELYYFENIGTRFTPIFDFVTKGNIRNSLSPYLVDLNNDGYADLVHGRVEGTLDYWENRATGNIGEFNRNPLIFAGIDVGDYARPTGGDLDGDGDRDIVVGSASGTLHHLPNLGTSTNPRFTINDLTLFAGIKTGDNLDPDLAVLETDELYDLVLSSAIGKGCMYDNTGTSASPDYRISSSYEVWPGMSYYPPNEFLKVLGEERIAGFIELLLTCEEYLVDEIAASIAYTSDNVLLLNEVIPKMFQENADYIYQTAPLLDYVELVEVGDYDTGDYYTTTRYRVLDNGTPLEITLPRDIYYKFIVHPKITEEDPMYIDPDTGNQAPPSPQGKGRFWREYLFNHNDSAYPEDPDPGDEYDRYPTDIYPPLLSDLLNGVDVLFNSTTHVAPGGRRADYGDNAIIRISNWVGKTLILNQQEVSDDERPTQPVRIAASHNGNCGELQDLTMAAARTALIPASGIIMLGEDHVWSEFWERGWHQWDNYWSDSGSVIDKQNNYWVGWGGRGGSGLYKWHGNDMIEDVTPQYIPREFLSDVTVKVVDRNGEPVDGARVVVGSHWLIENAGDTPVTAPFPSIWNYTDSDGISRFTLCNRNISMKIISRLGNGAVTKTYIGSGENYNFNITLEGRKPRPSPAFREVETPSGDNWRISYEMEVVSAYQRPPNANTGSVHTHIIEGGLSLDFAIIPEREMGRKMANQRAECYRAGTDGKSYNGEIFSDGAYKLFFMLSGCDQLETYKIIRVKMILSRKVEDRPFLSITEPTEGGIFTLDEDITIGGTAVDRGNLTYLNLSFGARTVSLLPHLHEGKFSYTISARILDEGEHVISVMAQNEHGYEAVDSVTIFISSFVPPEVYISRPADGSSFYLGALIEVRGGVETDKLNKLELKVDGMGFLENFDILHTYADGKFEYQLNTTGYPEGEYNLTIKAVDSAHLTGTDLVRFGLKKIPDTLPPELTIMNPINYIKLTTGEVLLVNGTVQDNEAIAELLLFTDSEMTDILGSLKGNEYRYEMDTVGMDEGKHTLEIKASDTSSNTITEKRYFVLEEPVPVEYGPPEIEFLEPSDYAVVEFGEEILIKAEIRWDADPDFVEFSFIGSDTWNDAANYYNPLSSLFFYRLNATEQYTGVLQFALRASDRNGGVSTEILGIDIRDTTAPNIEMIEDIDGKHYSVGGAVEVAVSVSDLSVIDDITLTLKGPGFRRELKAEMVGENYLFDINLENAYPGTFSVVVKVKDVEGNEAILEKTIIIDETPQKEEKEKDSALLGFEMIALIAGVVIIVLGIIGWLSWLRPWN